MRISVGSMVVIMTAFACYACGSSAAPPQPAASSTPSASTPASTSPSVEFGVAECDAYMKKYLACVDRLAPAAQTAARQALEQSSAAWKQAAGTEQGKAMLATTCKAASDSAAPAMRAQGCAW